VSLTERFDGFQQRHPAAGFPLAVVYKYVDDFGNYLSALITYYAFVSLFPLLLLLSTVLGFVLTGHPTLQHRVVESALHQFPVVGAQLDDPHHIGGGMVGIVIGIVGAVYGGLGVANATQYAMNTAWQVPRHSRPNPLTARLRSLVLVMTGGLAIVATTALSAFGGIGSGALGPILRVAAIVVAVILNVAVFLALFRIATARDLGLRDVAPGAVVAALVWQLLQWFGVVYVNHVVRHASDTNGVFALVLGLLAFLYVTSVTVVLCVELNVVRVEGLHPRALLTPFTDDVSLTRGDRRTYAGQAKTQRMKSFEDVDVQFRNEDNANDQDGDASPRRHQ
jgi:membrane protein